MNSKVLLLVLLLFGTFITTITFLLYQKSQEMPGVSKTQEVVIRTQNTLEASKKSSKSQVEVPTKQFTTNENLISFLLPENWTVIDTSSTLENARSVKLVQAGRIISDSGVQVDFVVQKSSAVVGLDSLIVCHEKATECKTVNINGVPFKESRAILNTGSTVIAVGAIQEDVVFRMTAVVIDSTNSNVIETIEKLLQTITFQVSH